MRINALQLRNFTVFEQVDFTFASGINVFIGENGTGKTHLLKLLYSVLRGAPRQPVDGPEAVRLQRNELSDVFKPDDRDVGRLVRASAEDEGASGRLTTDGGGVRFRIHGPSGEFSLDEQTLLGELGATFLPARDVLAMYENFIDLYTNRNISFDKTYYDICMALGAAKLRGEGERRANELASPIFKKLGGKVLLRGTRFYIDFGDGPREAHLVAEGLRKVAALARLVESGSIAPATVLLWDEPEANMNPRLIAWLAQVLHQLAASGVQIFVATHDFLLSQELSLIAEYDRRPHIEMRFFALHHSSRIAPVEVEVAKNLAEMHHNAILNEYAAHHDREQEAFGIAVRGERDEA